MMVVMHGKHHYAFEGYQIVFDFDNYRIRIEGDIPIDTYERIQNDEEFKFLYQCLISKYSREHELYDADKEKTVKLSDEYQKRYFHS